MRSLHKNYYLQPSEGDDAGIVPYGLTGQFHAFLSYGSCGTGKIPMAIKYVVYIKTIICNQTKRDDVGIVPYGVIGGFCVF